MRVEIDQRVLHLPVCGDHRAPVAFFGDFDLRLGGLYVRPDTGVERWYVECGREAEGKGLEDVSQREAARGCLAGQIECGQLRQARLAHQIVGLQHPEFCGDDVRPTREQVQWQ